MHHDEFARTRAAVSVACTLPLFAISLFAAGFRFMCSTLLSRLHLRRNTSGPRHNALWAAEEFRFEHAVEAYEELIDAIARSRQ
jgi:hypothetical protein